MRRQARRLRLTSVLPALAPLAAIALAVTFFASNGAAGEDEPSPSAVGTSTSEPAKAPSAGPTVTQSPVKPVSATPGRSRSLTPYAAPPSPTPPPGPVCTVTYVLVNTWEGGFQADVTVHNLGPKLNGWTLTWTPPPTQTITSLWNAVAQPAGAGVTVSNASWNGVVDHDATVSFGFAATVASMANGPSEFRLNGHPCTKT
jgi:cellulase/cellobiase CelA1